MHFCAVKSKKQLTDALMPTRKAEFKKLAYVIMWADSMLFTSLVFVDPDFGPTSQRFVSGLRLSVGCIAILAKFLPPLIKLFDIKS